MATLNLKFFSNCLSDEEESGKVLNKICAERSGDEATLLIHTLFQFMCGRWPATLVPLHFTLVNMITILIWGRSVRTPVTLV